MRNVIHIYKVRLSHNYVIVKVIYFIKLALTFNVEYQKNRFLSFESVFVT